MNHRQHSGRRRAGALGGLLALVWSVLAAVTASAPAAAASNLNLNVGGSNANGVDGQDFYPGLVTIHTNDTITWNFKGVHTVNLYTNPADDPESPAQGDNSFTGTSDPTRSGIKTPAPGDNTYALTFTTAGVYTYFCALHPGMRGLVEVNDGKTATTQAAADTTAASEVQADLAVGQAAFDAFTPSKQAGSGGASQFNLADGISDPQAVSNPVNAISPSTASGTAAVSLTFPAGQPNLHVVVTMTGLPANQASIPNHLHNGTCAVNPVAGLPAIAQPLTNLSSDGSGNATATTDIPWDPATMGPPVLPAHLWYVNVHDPANPSTSISCGDVITHPASALRFKSSKLSINAGDSVQWTMLDAHEVHPIFIGPADQEPANPFTPPAGGNTAASPNSALSSGPLFAGDSYKVTFAAPGRYQYMCTLHDVVGMVGEIDVLPTGYRAVASDGGVFNFGTSSFNGSMGGTKLNSPVVSSANTPTNKGYWEAAADGGIFNFGDAGFFGSMGGTKLNKPIVGMAATPTGKGYWLVASDGGVFNFGDAKFFGSMGGTKLNQPIVGIAAAANGAGYWLVASDGGIFNFGSAAFKGSMGGTKLNKPVVGMTATPTGAGYLMVASDGGIFTFGDAGFFGSMGGKTLNKPVVAILVAPDGLGYWLVATDGGVFTFGSSAFFGSTGGITLNKPVVSMSF